MALPANGLVETFHLGERISLQTGRIEQGLPADQQHAELRAPVAQVVVRNDTVAQQPERARQGVAQYGRADMTDVHRLGHIRRTEIDDYALWMPGGFEEEMFPARSRLQGCG